MTATEPTNGRTLGWGTSGEITDDLADVDLDQLPHTDERPDGSPDVTSIFGAGNVPSVERLKAAIDLAERVRPLQRNDDLLAVRSDDEFAAELEQQRQFRDDWRDQAAKDHDVAIGQAERQRKHEDQLATDQAAHEHEMAREQQKHQQQLATSARERDRLLDPNVEVRKAQQSHKWLPKLALVPSVVAALVSAANLAIQGARVIEGPAALGAAVGTGIDAVFTVGLIAITLGRMSGVVTDGVRSSTRSYLGGEIGIGAGLAAASIIAHHLPSADGSVHATSQAWWFVLLPFMFALSAVYGPKLQADTKDRLVHASNDARVSGGFGGLTDGEAKVLRLARWVADQDENGLVPGERDVDGLPSVKGVERAIRAHLGKCRAGLAKRVRDTYALTLFSREGVS